MGLYSRSEALIRGFLIQCIYPKLKYVVLLFRMSIVILIIMYQISSTESRIFEYMFIISVLFFACQKIEIFEQVRQNIELTHYTKIFQSKYNIINLNLLT